ncbi:MAG: hypothetical protein K6C05_09880 [Anaerovibrio sp.]|uniref:hypothetical protein n=1 Tax=Anaerovibrio sp. TaxID=1872532 RepID=UPI0025E24DA6|nr:hypothetical protein [Anaerovibrio sp.]MCR5177142.1 hypothetical protein [Anaerovibrio sp.]
MEFKIDLETVEKVMNIIIENLDPKYKDIIDPAGMDNLKNEIRKNPELQDYFKGGDF